MYNASDDAPIRMGDYFDLVAESFGLPRPPRVTRAEAEATVPAQLFSFMDESRRLANRRLKAELRLKLRYPTVREGIAAARATRV
jgi:nucleoside-diphosphate-sugar epimerase